MKAFLCMSLLACIGLSIGCGITTHIEISHRAKTYFQDSAGSTSKVDYAKLILKHQDALMAGSPYPDAFYDSVCADGKYHDVSEDTHWAPFLNATVNYIRQKYPQPWDEATEKLVVFMFGVVSHQVADIVWHSIGIDQGFLATMGKINFHGSFDKAHPIGDFGGDILANYEMNMTYIPLEQGWYIPTEDLYNIYSQFYSGTAWLLPRDIITVCSLELFIERYIPTEDLFNIYKDYYGKSTMMPSNIIQECTLVLFLGRLAEVLAVRELFPDYAKKSPWMVDQFEKYFLGGVDDMAGWTHRLWQETITMLERGTEVCDIPKSTLFLQCNVSAPRMHQSNRNPGRNGYYVRPPRNGVSQDDVTIEKTLRGVRVKPTQTFMNKLRKKQQKDRESLYYSKQKHKLDAGTPRQPDRILYARNDYARLGSSFATGDLNFDGKEDLVVSAPGYGRLGSPQEGRVYIIYGDDDGLPSALNTDLDDLEIKGQGQIMKGWGTAQFRFGTTVAVVDINLDGADDLAVGSPAAVLAGDSPLQYNGNVMIYFGIPSKHEVANGAANITIACQKSMYCNLGFSMTVGDTNGDGHPDLIFGSPFAPEGGEQRGFVTGLESSKYNTGYQYMDVTDLKWKTSGTQDYGWLGYDIVHRPWHNGPARFFNVPEFRKCQLSNCSYSEEDVQAIGRITADLGGKLGPVFQWSLDGQTPFSQLGWSVDVGAPYPDKTNYVIAASELGKDVMGKLAGTDYMFNQAGQVILYNSTQGAVPVKNPFVLQGDRAYERFGAKVKFLDLNGDGMDDLLIGAPFRSEDITEELFGAEQGQVYVYYGGENFPYERSKADCGNAYVHPCPRFQSSVVLEWIQEESKTRFGTNFALLRGKNKSQLLVTAEHASRYGRLAGAIAVFDV